MRPRYIVRPKGILTTPSLLKVSLGAKRTIARDSSRAPDWFRDFFLDYPPLETLQNVHTADALTVGQNRQTRHTSQPRPTSLVAGWMEDYRLCSQFSRGSKPLQRLDLAREGLPCPPTATQPNLGNSIALAAMEAGYPSRRFIVRPLRHRAGQGWRITEDPTDFIEGEEYVQSVYPKNHEYRVIAVRGVPIITLLKRVPSDTPRTMPWNHSCGSTFVTVTDPSNDRLRNTDIYERIRASSLFKHLDLIGIDVMYRRGSEYAVSEVNLCPALQITSNLEKVVRYVHSLPQR